MYPSLQLSQVLDFRFIPKIIPAGDTENGFLCEQDAHLPSLGLKGLRFLSSNIARKTDIPDLSWSSISHSISYRLQCSMYSPCSPRVAEKKAAASNPNRSTSTSWCTQHGIGVRGLAPAKCSVSVSVYYMEVSWNGGTPKSSIYRWDFPPKKTSIFG